MNRRTVLRSSAALVAGCSSGVLAAGAVVAIRPAEAVASDPCLTFMNGWASAITECEQAVEQAADPDAIWHAVVGPYEFGARDGHVPPATTAAGAAAALRKIIDADDSDAQDLSLIRAALAYLEGDAS